MYFKKRAANKSRKKLLNQFIYNDASLTEEETARFAVLIVGSISGINNCRIFTNGENLKDEFKKIADNSNISDQFPDAFQCNNSEQSVLNYCATTFKNHDLFLLRDENEIIGIILCEQHNHQPLTKQDQELLLDVSKILEGRISKARNDAAIKEKEDMLAQINSLLAESQLVSLRAQMNPHFVFNCLNSIQESIVMKHYAEAGMYLNKFSKLFRKVLQNSSKNLIPLAEEIEVLQLYLQLEHMRFQESFDFDITYDDALDPDEINIPSMLLQPFVENALWHGLMHKQGPRKISIRFYPKNDEVFICEIEDNGIGRAKAAEIKKQKSASTKHESKGIAISIDRLNLINKKQESQASVEIIDLIDEEGNARGTKVIFELSSFL